MPAKIVFFSSRIPKNVALWEVAAIHEGSEFP